MCILWRGAVGEERILATKDVAVNGCGSLTVAAIQMKVLSRLWKEEDGAIVSPEIVVVTVLLVLGMIVGLRSVREAVVTELADFAGAMGGINQSYSFAGITGHHSSTASSAWTDALDSCDVCEPASGRASQCVAVCTAAPRHEFSGPS
jgi:Flp pilus assembly pilin Flp